MKNIKLSERLFSVWLYKYGLLFISWKQFSIWNSFFYLVKNLSNRPLVKSIIFEGSYVFFCLKNKTTPTIDDIYDNIDTKEIMILLPLILIALKRIVIKSHGL